MSETRIQSFEEFWPYYLGEHRDPMCRGLHYVGTALAMGSLAAGVITLNPFAIAATPVFGYSFAWAAHLFVEHNRPATFKYPMWSLRADYKMLFLALRGKMKDEMIKYYGSTRPTKDQPRVDIVNAVAAS